MTTPCIICDFISPSFQGTRYVIHDGKHWRLEHIALPTEVLGWLRIVTKRHIEAMHELTNDEAAEMTAFLTAAARTLHTQLKSDKEYLMSFGEGPGVRHLHIHIVNKQAKLSEEFRGAKIFGLLNNGNTKKAVSENKIQAFCKKFKPLFLKNLKKL